MYCPKVYDEVTEDAILDVGSPYLIWRADNIMNIRMKK